MDATTDTWTFTSVHCKLTTVAIHRLKSQVSEPAMDVNIHRSAHCKLTNIASL